MTFQRHLTIVYRILSWVSPLNGIGLMNICLNITLTTYTVLRPAPPIIYCAPRNPALHRLLLLQRRARILIFESRLAKLSNSPARPARSFTHFTSLHTTTHHITTPLRCPQQLATPS
jgi:hypothetical protein